MAARRSHTPAARVPSQRAVVSPQRPSDRAVAAAPHSAGHHDDDGGGGGDDDQYPRGSLDSFGAASMSSFTRSATTFHIRSDDELSDDDGGDARAQASSSSPHAYAVRGRATRQRADDDDCDDCDDDDDDGADGDGDDDDIGWDEEIEIDPPRQRGTATTHPVGYPGSGPPLSPPSSAHGAAQSSARGTFGPHGAQIVQGAASSMSEPGAPTRSRAGSAKRRPGAARAAHSDATRPEEPVRGANRATSGRAVSESWDDDFEFDDEGGEAGEDEGLEGGPVGLHNGTMAASTVSPRRSDDADANGSEAELSWDSHDWEESSHGHGRVGRGLPSSSSTRTLRQGGGSGLRALGPAVGGSGQVAPATPPVGHAASSTGGDGWKTFGRLSKAPSRVLPGPEAAAVDQRGGHDRNPAVYARAQAALRRQPAVDGGVADAAKLSDFSSLLQEGVSSWDSHVPAASGPSHASVSPNATTGGREDGVDDRPVRLVPTEASGSARRSSVPSSNLSGLAPGETSPAPTSSLAKKFLTSSRGEASGVAPNATAPSPRSRPMSMANAPTSWRPVDDAGPAESVGSTGGSPKKTERSWAAVMTNRIASAAGSSRRDEEPSQRPPRQPFVFPSRATDDAGARDKEAKKIKEKPKEGEASGAKFKPPAAGTPQRHTRASASLSLSFGIPTIGALGRTNKSPTSPTSAKAPWYAGRRSSKDKGGQGVADANDSRAQDVDTNDGATIATASEPPKSAPSDAADQRRTPLWRRASEAKPASPATAASPSTAPFHAVGERSASASTTGTKHSASLISERWSAAQGSGSCRSMDTEGTSAYGSSVDSERLGPPSAWQRFAGAAERRRGKSVADASLWTTRRRTSSSSLRDGSYDGPTPAGGGRTSRSSSGSSSAVAVIAEAASVENAPELDAGAPSETFSAAPPLPPPHGESSSTSRRDRLRRNSLGDLRIPTRISQAQQGIRTNMNHVRDFARGVQELRQLQMQHDALLERLGLPAAPEWPVGAGTAPTSGQLAAAKQERTYASWWECADVLVGLGQGRSEADDVTDVSTASVTSVPPRPSLRGRRITLDTPPSFTPGREASGANSGGARQASPSPAVSDAEFSGASQSGSLGSAARQVRLVNAQREVDILSAILSGTPPSHYPAASKLDEGHDSPNYADVSMIHARGRADVSHDGDSWANETSESRRPSQAYSTAPAGLGRAATAAMSTDSIASRDGSGFRRGRLRSAGKAGIQGLRDLLRALRIAAPERRRESAGFYRLFGGSRASLSRLSVSDVSRLGGSELDLGSRPTADDLSRSPLAERLGPTSPRPMAPPSLDVSPGTVAVPGASVPSPFSPTESPTAPFSLQQDRIRRSLHRPASGAAPTTAVASRIEPSPSPGGRRISFDGRASSPEFAPAEAALPFRRRLISFGKMGRPRHAVGGGGGGGGEQAVPVAGPLNLDQGTAPGTTATPSLPPTNPPRSVVVGRLRGAVEPALPSGVGGGGGGGGLGAKRSFSDTQRVTPSTSRDSGAAAAGWGVASSSVHVGRATGGGAAVDAGGGGASAGKVPMAFSASAKSGEAGASTDTLPTKAGPSLARRSPRSAPSPHTGSAASGATTTTTTTTTARRPRELPTTDAEAAATPDSAGAYRKLAMRPEAIASLLLYVDATRQHCADAVRELENVVVVASSSTMAAAAAEGHRAGSAAEVGGGGGGGGGGGVGGNWGGRTRRGSSETSDGAAVGRVGDGGDVVAVGRTGTPNATLAPSSSSPSPSPSTSATTRRFSYAGVTPGGESGSPARSRLPSVVETTSAAGREGHAPQAQRGQPQEEPSPPRRGKRSSMQITKPPRWVG